MGSIASYSVYWDEHTIRVHTSIDDYYTCESNEPLKIPFNSELLKKADITKQGDISTSMYLHLLDAWEETQEKWLVVWKERVGNNIWENRCNIYTSHKEYELALHLKKEKNRTNTNIRNIFGAKSA